MRVMIELSVLSTIDRFLYGRLYLFFWDFFSLAFRLTGCFCIMRR